MRAVCFIGGVCVVDEARVKVVVGFLRSAYGLGFAAGAAKTFRRLAEEPIVQYVFGIAFLIGFIVGGILARR